MSIIYLKDALMKTPLSGPIFVQHFMNDLFKSMCETFREVNEETRQEMVRIVNIWKNIGMIDWAVLDAVLNEFEAIKKMKKVCTRNGV